MIPCLPTLKPRELTLKGAESRNRKQTCYLHIVAHTWPLCSAQILVDGVNPLEGHFQKSTNISAIVERMSISLDSLRSSRVHLQNNTFILRKKVENLGDLAYQKYCKIVISKELCLYYVTPCLWRNLPGAYRSMSCCEALKEKYDKGLNFLPVPFLSA